jgi:hypothetical protein
VCVLARFSLAGLAVIVCAWFALGTRQAHDLNAATSIATSGKITPAQAAHADSLLDTAGTLNPDQEVKLVRAQVAFNSGNSRQAIALAQQVANEEPQNVLAWDEIAKLNANHPQVLLVAFNHIRELSPPVGGQGH